MIRMMRKGILTVFLFTYCKVYLAHLDISVDNGTLVPYDADMYGAGPKAYNVRHGGAPSEIEITGKKIASGPGVTTIVNEVVHEGIHHSERGEEERLVPVPPGSELVLTPPEPRLVGPESRLVGPESRLVGPPPGMGMSGVALGARPAEAYSPIQENSYAHHHHHVIESGLELGAGMGPASQRGPISFGMEHSSKEAISIEAENKSPFFGGHMGSMPVSSSAWPLMGTGPGSSAEFGNGPTKDEILHIVFSITEDDSYLVLTNLYMNLPIKTLVSNVTITSNETFAKDRSEFLMYELEGKASSIEIDNGLNILSSRNMFFYIPKTAISITIQIGKVFFSEKYVNFIRRLKLNYKVFMPITDFDGYNAYYIPIYGATIALPNPQTPIVSQFLLTPEGYGLDLSQAKKLEITKGVLVLNSQAYNESDIAKVDSLIQKFTSGEITNPSQSTFLLFGFDDKQLDDQEYISSDSSSSSHEKSKNSKSVKKKKKTSDYDDSSSSSSSSSDIYNRSSNATDEVSEESEYRQRYGDRGQETVNSLMAKSFKWREKASLASIHNDKKTAKRALKKARKAARRAKALENKNFNNKLLADRTLSAGGAAKQASKGALLQGDASSLAGTSWYSSEMKKNLAIKAIIDTKKQSLEQVAGSAFEESSRKTIANSFTSNGASAIISAHQSNEIYYKGVSSSEYATREIKHSLMGMTMQHALFSTKGRMYQSQKHMSYNVRSSRSSSKWLSRRVSQIKKSKRAESRASRKFMRSGTTSQGVARAAAKEHAARAAAIKASSKAAKSHAMAKSFSQMAKKAEAQKNRKMARSYKRSASKYMRSAKIHSSRAKKFGKALSSFRKAKMVECNKQSNMLSQRLSRSTELIGKKDSKDLNVAVMQILRASQIQILNKILTSLQLKVLTNMFGSQQIQKILIQIGGMPPMNMQMLLLKLHIKAAELEKKPEDHMMLLPMVNMNPPALNINTAYRLPSLAPVVGNVMMQIHEKPRQQAASRDILKYFMQEAPIFQSQEIQLGGKSLEIMKAKAQKQAMMIQKLIMQLNANRKEVEARVRDKILGDRMKSSVSMCNPMLGLQTGIFNEAFDGISSKAGLKLAGFISLGESAFNAIKQLLVSPSVASYIGIDQNMLSQMLYGQTNNDDIMCLLSKSSIASPLYNRMSSDEKSLISARFNNTHSRLIGIYGNSLSRLEQALVSAFNLIRNSMVKCRGANSGQAIPFCQINPMPAG